MLSHVPENLKFSFISSRKEMSEPDKADVSSFYYIKKENLKTGQINLKKFKIFKIYSGLLKGWDPIRPNLVMMLGESLSLN